VFSVASISELAETHMTDTRNPWCTGMLATSIICLILVRAAFAVPICPSSEFEPRAIQTSTSTTTAQVVETLIAIFSVALFTATYSILTNASGYLTRTFRLPTKVVVENIRRILTFAWPDRGPHKRDVLNKLYWVNA
jgi:hypothetical protein